MSLVHTKDRVRTTLDTVAVAVIATMAVADAGCHKLQSPQSQVCLKQLHQTIEKHEHAALQVTILTKLHRSEAIGM